MLEGTPDRLSVAASHPESAAALQLNERLRAEATAVVDDDDREAALLKAAQAALAGYVTPSHLVVLATTEARAHAALARGDIDEALRLFKSLDLNRDNVYKPLPHPRVALDYVTLSELAAMAGDRDLAQSSRARAIALLERTAAPNSQHLDDLRVAYAMADNEDLDVKLAGLSVTDGADPRRGSADAEAAEPDPWAPSR